MVPLACQHMCPTPKLLDQCCSLRRLRELPAALLVAQASAPWAQTSLCLRRAAPLGTSRRRSHPWGRVTELRSSCRTDEAPPRICRTTIHSMASIAARCAFRCLLRVYPIQRLVRCPVVAIGMANSHMLRVRCASSMLSSFSAFRSLRTACSVIQVAGSIVPLP